MKLVVLDLEMNQPSGAIIQIGVCLLDCRTGVIADRMTRYVRLPAGESLNPEIAALCHINPEQVEWRGVPEEPDMFSSQPNISIEEALRWLWTYVGSKPVAAWGGDIELVEDVSRTLGVEHKSPRGIDLKVLGMMMRALVGSRSRGGLKKTMELFGLDFQGQQHDACADAFNTARLLWYWLHRVQAAETFLKELS